MAKYIVVALSCHSDLKQRVFRHGQIVVDADFHEGHAEKLCSQGFLRTFTEADAEAMLLKQRGVPLPDITLPDVTPPAAESPGASTDKNPAGEGDQDPPPPPTEVDKTDYEAMTNKELKALLDEKGVGYDAKANKKTLIELLTGAQ